MNTLYTPVLSHKTALLHKSLLWAPKFPSHSRAMLFLILSNNLKVKFLVFKNTRYLTLIQDVFHSRKNTVSDQNFN